MYKHVNRLLPSSIILLVWLDLTYLDCIDCKTGPLPPGVRSRSAQLDRVCLQ